MLPVILFTGFLGAGKTTVLLNFLREGADRGRKLAVVVNEFGAVDIDGAVLRAAQMGELAAIAGGCACCAGQDDFIQTLMRLASRPAEIRPEAVVVEASGLADPVAMLDSMTAPGKNPYFEVRHILTVVDAAAWNAVAAAAGPLLRRQLALADTVILNKADLVEDANRARVEEKVAGVTSTATMQWAARGEADFTILWSAIESGPVKPERKQSEPGGTTHPAAHTLFVPVPHPAERAALETELLALPPEVWRVKGFVRLRGEPGLWLVQATAGEDEPFVHLAPFHLPFGMDEPALGLVFLGAKLDFAKLMERFGGHRVMAVF